MHILQHRLASVRRRYRFIVGLRGLFAVAAVVAGAAALIGLADYHTHLPSLIRAYGLVATLGGAGWVAFRYFIRPLATRCDDLSLALRIEDAYPELNDALASTVQFIEADNVPGSASMRNRAVEKALDATSDLDFGRILDRRGLLYSFVAAAVACSFAGYFVWYHGDLARTALLRLVEPFGHHTWTRINVEDVPTRIAVGQPFPLHGSVAGIVPAQVRIEIESLGDKGFDKRSEKVVPLKMDAKSGEGILVTALDVTQHRGRFRFRILGNDGRYPAEQAWQEVEVKPPPMFANLDGLPSPQIALHPPDYAELPSPQKLSPGTRHLEVLQGTRVTFRAAVDRALASAWIELRPLDPTTRLAPWLGMLCQTQPLELLGFGAAQHGVAGRYHATLDDTRTVLSVEFTPWATGSYVLRLVDNDGLIKDYEADLRITHDPVPMVQLLRPASSTSVLPEAEIVFRVLAEDDFFAIRTLYLEYRRRDADSKTIDPPRRFVLYDPSLSSWGLEQIAPGPLPTPWLAPELQLRPKRLEIAKVWSLQKQFKEGDVLLVHAGSEDFCNVVKPRTPGRSPEVEIRIVGRGDLAKMLDEGLGQVQQELVRLQKLQQEAIDLVNKLDKQKPGQKAMDQLVEAEQLQKQIQERIGNRPDEGLREQLQKMDQLIRDNKLPPNEATDHVKELQAELNRLAQEELPKIEQNLSEAKKELTGTQKAAPDAKQSPLKKAGEQQKRAKEALDQLARSLDQWADVNVVKGQLRELIQLEKDAAKATEGLKKQKEELAKAPNAVKKAEFQDHLQQQTTNQAELAGKTQELQTQMEKVLAQQDKGSKEFNQLGQKLKKAGRLEENERAQEFRAISKEARELAGKQQEEDAKQSLQQLAKELDQAANQLEKGKMPEDAQNEFQREAQKKLKQAQNEASPAPLKNLKEAVKIGQESNVAETMQKAVKELMDKVPNLDQARANQDEAVKNLEKMLAALEGRDDDGLDRLRKKQKQLAKAEENVDKLEKKARDAKQTKDPKEKAEELRNLAQEARDNARELARLQEEKASKELNRAAQMLEDAAAKLDQGQNAEAEELEREAMERIDEARRRLEEFEEELAREQLARIADRLKGLKERQDAAVERTQEMQKRLLKSQEWTKGLRTTLDADKMTQEGLAKETRDLQEKIKEAKVFEHVMDKAAKAMDKAAEAMTQRKELAAERNIPFDDADQKDEARLHDEVFKLQSQASARLQRLLDALKEEMQAAQNEKNEEQPMEGGDQGGARPRPADGIPPMAELKALRAEQLEVNERTKDFAQRHPNPMNLGDAERRELTELEAEQRRLREIFAGMTAKKGDMP